MQSPKLNILHALQPSSYKMSDSSSTGSPLPYKKCAFCREDLNPVEPIETDNNCGRAFHNEFVQPWEQGKLPGERACPSCHAGLTLNPMFLDSNASVITKQSHKICKPCRTLDEFGGVEVDEELATILERVRPGISYEGLSAVQRLELMEYRCGRSIYNMPKRLPSSRNKFKTIPAQYRSNFADVFYDSSVVRITTIRRLGSISPDDPVILYHKISPQLIARLQQEKHPWERAQLCLEIADKTDFLTPWYMEITNLARTRFDYAHNLIPVTWVPYPRSRHSLILAPDGYDTTQTLHQMLEAAIRELGYEPALLHECIPAVIQELTEILPEFKTLEKNPEHQLNDGFNNGACVIDLVLATRTRQPWRSLP